MKLLVVTGLPHHLEAQIPSVWEAERRGWDVGFALEGNRCGWLLDQAKAEGPRFQYGGVWSGKALSVPQASKILDAFMPDAALLSPSGHGQPGGAWLEELLKREIPSVEFMGGSQRRVFLHDSSSREYSLRYMKELKAAGYGKEHHQRVLAETPSEQWVGLQQGDYVFRTRFKRDYLRVGDYVVVMPSWSRSERFARFLTERLAEWVRLTKDQRVTLVLSPHPVSRYSPDLMKPHGVPMGVLTSSCFPGQYQGRIVVPCPTPVLVARARGVIVPHWSGASFLAQAMGVPEWNCWEAHARTEWWRDKWKGIKPRFRPSGPHQAVRLPWRYRSNEDLEKMIAGELPAEADRDGRNDWLKEYRFRLDGRVCERVMDLLK